jgi:amino acid adenylation domain-containing protein
MIDNLSSYFTWRCQREPDALAYAFVRDSLEIAQSISCAELERKVHELAAEIARHSAPGDRVLLTYPAGLEFALAFWACILSGRIAVPVPALDPARLKGSLPRLNAIVADAQAKLALTHSELLEAARALQDDEGLCGAVWIASDAPRAGANPAPASALPKLGPDSVAYLQYTSGSTTAPRGVIVTHANLLDQCRTLAAALQLDTQRSRLLCWLPHFHDYGLVFGVLLPLHAGVPSYLMSPLTFLRRPLRWLEAAGRFGISHTGAPNFAYDACIKALAQQPAWRADLSTLVSCSCGAEPIHADMAQRFQAAFEPHGLRTNRFAPAYGMAEAVLCVSVTPPGTRARLLSLDPDVLAQRQVREASADAAHARRVVGCGVALQECSLRIVDPQSLVPCAPDQIGEIWIQSSSVGLGYWRREPDSADVFQARTAAGEGPYLRSGDLGFIAQGQLYVTGRLKDLIIVHGRNHAPQDIEWTVQACGSSLRPGYGAAFSIVTDAGEALVIVQEVERGVGEAELVPLARAIRRAVALEHELPVHAVALIQPGTAPRTTSGKIRRQSCRQMYLEGSLQARCIDVAEQNASAGEHEAPQGQVEVALAGVWAQVLNLDRVGRHDNFFALGGHSLMLMTLIQRMRSVGLVADARAIFANQTVAALAQAIRDTGACGAAFTAAENLIAKDCTALHPDLLPLIELTQADLDAIVAAVPGGAANVKDMYALAPLQEGLLFHHRLQEQGDPYLLRLVVAFDERDTLDRFLAALQAVIDRHDAMRTALLWRGLTRPAQVVLRHAQLPVTTVVASGDADPAEHLLRITDPSVARLDLGRAPMLAASVTKTREAAQWHLALLIHHMWYDHVTLDVVWREIQAFMRGASATLAPPVAFRNFVAQSRVDRSAEHEACYRKMLESVDQPTAPFGLLRLEPTAELHDGQRVLEPVLAARLRGAARAAGVTAAAVFHLAWALVLARCSARDDVVFGSVVSGRLLESEGVDRAVGVFINTLAVRIDLRGANAKQALAQTQQRLIDLVHHEQAALALAQRCSGVPAALPLICALLNYRHGTAPWFDAEGRAIAPALAGVRRVRVDERTNYPLSLSVDDWGQGFDLGVQCVVGLDPQRIAGYVVSALEVLLSALESAEQTPLTALQILPAPEVEQMLRQWSRADRGGGDRGRTAASAEPQFSALQRQIEHQVRCAPRAVAALFGDLRLSYGQLNEQANRLAHVLRRAGVGRDVPVGVCMDRSLELVVAVLGVLKAGGAYVPMDPALPGERLAYQLRDTAAPVLLTQSHLLERLPQAGGALRQVLCLDPGARVLTEGEADDAHWESQPTDLAYVIYTSGSTGRPKGVLLEHAGLSAHARWLRERLGVVPADRLLAITSIGFDASLVELLHPLAAGAAVELAPPGAQHDTDMLARLIRERGISVLQMVPSALRTLLEEPSLDPARLRYVISGGEALGVDLAHALQRRLPGATFGNFYGPTEVSIDATHCEWPIAAGGSSQVPIGRPIDHAQCLVLDAHRQLLPLGVAGELWIGGAGLARGYLNSPELNAERFVAHPFEPGQRLYRSGDLARFRDDGMLEYLGRADSQVKISGHRIELGEIEALLAAQPGVRHCAVLAREGAAGMPRLVAFAAGQALQGAALQRALGAVLPDYMVPTSIVVLEQMPLLPSGKVNRSALPVVEMRQAQAVLVAPRDAREQAIWDIWRDVLRLDRFGVDDNFFELGGHSLLAMQVAARLRAALHVELPLRTLFDAPSVAALARALAQLEAAAPGAAPRQQAGFEPIAARDSDAAVPLSPVQTGMWLAAQVGEDPSAYHMCWALRLRGELNRPALRAALQALVRRHDILRLSVAERDGTPVQQTHEQATLSLQEHDASALPPERRSEQLEQVLRRARQQPFDLTQAPLARACLVELGPLEHALQIVLHHLICDAASEALLRHELSALYAQFCGAAPAPQPTRGIGYLDYAAWEHARIQAGALRPQLDYWRKQLHDIVPLNLPLAARAAQQGSGASASIGFDLPGPLVQELETLARRHGATMFMLYLAAFKVLLMRWSGQDDIAVGTPIARRDDPQLAPLVGPLLNTLVLRTSLAGAPSFGALLQRVRDSALEAYRNQDQPFSGLVMELNPPRLSGRNPLFDVLVNSVGDWGGTEAWHALACEPLHTQEAAAKFALTLYLHSAPGAARFMLNFRTDLLSRPQVARLAEQFEHLLHQVAHAPQLPIDALVLVNGAARGALPDPTLALGPVRPARLHDAFLQIAESSPLRMALSAGSAQLSYRELEECSRGLAQALHGAGVAQGDRVAIVADRHPALVVAVLGCARAGAVFTLLDAAYPQTRNAECIAQLEPRLILDCTGGTQRGEFKGVKDVTIRIERAAPDLCAQFPPGDAALPEVDASAPAYISFTSGTSGRPKGIVTGHAALPHFVQWHVHQHALTPHDRFALLSGIAHDPLLRDIFTPLSIGATLSVPEQGQLFEPARLAAWLERERISVAHLTPALGQLIAAGAETGTVLPALRCLFWSGEVLGRATLRRIAPIAPNATHVNFYGTTETPQAMAHHAVAADEDGSAIAIGRGIDAAQLLLLTEGGALAAIGHPAEIVIRSPYLALGYLGDDEATRRKFIRNPFSDDPADRCYRTGDLGRYREDASVEYLGRIDRQVKVRGFRVEPAEIERLVESLPGVARALVHPVPDALGGTSLVLYFATHGAEPIGQAGVWEQICLALPSYMWPRHVMRIESFPVLPGGKVDMRALPVPNAQAFMTPEPEPPRGRIETTLAAIWRALLGIDNVNRHDNFFQLGGHSLLATQLVSRLREALGLELPLRRVFDAPVLAALATAVEQTLDAAAIAPRLPAIVRQPRERLLPTSYSQRRMWLIQQFNPTSAAYNMPLALRLSGLLQRAALADALQGLIARHEALRTTLVAVDGEPMQRIVPRLHVELEFIDLRAHPPTERDALATTILKERNQCAYELESGPLHRMTLLCLGEQAHVLFWSIHHAVGDGWSSGILLRELAALYSARVRGTLPLLAPKELEFADYAAWQRQVFSGELLERQLAHWRGVLQGLAPLPLPVDRPRVTAHDGRGARISKAIAPLTLAGIKALALEHGATPFMALLACFQVVLGRFCGVDDVAVATPIANRTQHAAETMVGALVNTVVMRASLAGNPSFAELLRRVRESALLAYAHQDLPFEVLVEALGAARSDASAPLAQVLFNVVGSPEAARTMDGLECELFEFDGGTSQFDLGLSVDTEVFGQAHLSFATDLFDASTGARLLDSYLGLLDQAVAAPGTALASFDLVGAHARAQLTVWNSTARPAPAAQTIHALLDLQAQRTPQRVALRFGAASLSYAQVQRRSNQLARLLRARGIGRGALVGLCVERSLEMVLAQLAILKSGAAYVPLDPAYPRQRLAAMCTDARVTLLIGESGVRPRELTQRDYLLLDAAGAAIDAQSDAALAADPRFDAGPADPAYAIYTSGSSGQPKGVLVPHGAAVNFLASMAHEPGLHQDDVLVAVTTLSFDISLLELLLPLTLGAQSVIASRAQATEGLALSALLASSAASAMQATPSTWRLLIDAGWRGAPGLKALVGGEALPLDLAQQLLARSAAVWNLYGPTETTVWSTCWRVERPERGIRIGRPIANTQIHVLDAQRQLCPIGVAGEIYIGGAGVALGYLNRPELSAERFIADPFRAEPGARLYRTGDRARWRDDGQLEHLGRLDRQVKLRGHRIELGEVEAQLSLHPEVAQAVVTVREDRAGDPRLVAYVVARESAAASAASLREHLRKRLPEPMLPQHFVPMGALPLLPNGKLNWQALPAPAQEAKLIAIASDLPEAGFELAVAQVWEELLGVDPITRRDNFFDLGGHSLLALRAVALIEQRTGVKLEPRSLVFESLAQLCGQGADARQRGLSRRLAQAQPEDTQY